MGKELSMRRDVLNAIFEACNPSGMTCSKCNRNNIVFTEIVEDNDKVTAIDIFCTNCMNTFATISIEDVKGCGGQCSCSK